SSSRVKRLFTEPAPRAKLSTSSVGANFSLTCWRSGVRNPRRPPTRTPPSAQRLHADFLAMQSLHGSESGRAVVARAIAAAGLATLGTSYTVWCAATGAQTPCVEVDRTQRLNATTTATSRGFYDGLGRLVETRTPAPGGQDVVRYSTYDVNQRLVFQSVPY